MSTSDLAPFGAVVIGRNEGERLRRCLASLPAEATVVYVDSGSTDGSVDWARSKNVEVLELATNAPFTAARARNAGFRRLRDIAPLLNYVQFVDGDCEIVQDWPRHAVSFLDEHADVCAAFGRLRERQADRSIYNFMCDIEWNVPVGESRACGGIVMMRAEALASVGGFREDMIAGEEPELCVRLRATGARIFRLDHEMALHDAAMTRFSQWWRRQTRSGYAFAQGASLHGSLPERHWVWESRRAILWGAIFPSAFALLTILFWPWGLAAWLIYPLQILRRSRRLAGPPRLRATIAMFELLSRFPEALGQFQFMLDRLSKRQRALIEYK